MLLVPPPDVRLVVGTLHALQISGSQGSARGSDIESRVRRDRPTLVPGWMWLGPFPLPPKV